MTPVPYINDAGCYSMRNKLIENFNIPECAYQLINTILNYEEQQLISLFTPEEVFSSKEVSLRLHLTLDQADSLLQASYKRNIINITQFPHYTISSFYERLGTFCQYEGSTWHSLDKEVKSTLSNWYLQTFIQRTILLWGNNMRPDKVAPLEEAIHFIKEHEGNFYLTKCDCRSIFGNCDHSLETCINFSEEPNSPYHRGNARQITKEEAISLVQTCNQEGLIHTLEGNHGLCNCCGDCCFEYRSAIMCDTIGIWPITNTIASWNKSACINCGICVKRCPMKAFTKTQNGISFNEKRCVGCGLCTNKCPKAAIILNKRNKKNKIN